MQKIRLWCALVGALALVGCGGGTGTSGGDTTRAAVYLTDSFREDYAHVWATIYHVELVPQTGTPIVLFDDTAGHLIDLKTLRDATGERFSFLGSASIPAGTYTGITVTVGATMQLFKNGVATGDPLPVASSLPRDANGHPQLSLTFANPKTLGAGTNILIVDFDLARFIVRSSEVLPALGEGHGNGLHDRGRHNTDEYHGTVSDLTGTAPDLTFTLNRGNGMKVTAVTNASTTLYGSGTLANGSMVEVQGTLDPTTNNLVATQLEVRDGNSEGGGPRSPRVMGTASNLNATNGTFTVTVEMARGLSVAQTTVNVVTTNTTTFRVDNGNTATQADFFTALATTPKVMVAGTYDAASNTLTAVHAKVVDGSHAGGWEKSPHPFRPGINRDNWGHGVHR